MSQEVDTRHTVDPDAQRARAKQIRRRLWGDSESQRLSVLAQFEPRLRDVILRELYGTIYADDRLSLETRSLCTIASLVTQGRPHQLESHFRAALRIGIPLATLSALLEHLVLYTGLPLVIDAFRALAKIVEDGHGLDGAPSDPPPESPADRS